MAFARGAKDELVGRPKRFDVESDGSVSYLVVTIRKELQAAVVRGDDRRDSLLVQEVHDTGCDGGALLGIRANAEFIQQDK